MATAHHAELHFAYSIRSVAIPVAEHTADIVDQYFERFGIDDARELVRQAHNRPQENAELLLIVRAEFVTLEAQNALLKVLEEPPVSTRFVFVLAPDCMLLPTLRSRFELASTVLNDTDEQNEAFQSFHAASLKERLESIDKAAKQKNLEWQRHIKQGLITYVGTVKNGIRSEVLASLEYVSRTLLTRGASNKMLLEHAALLLTTRS